VLALGVTAIAAFVDMQRQETLGLIYQGAYIIGCVSAVCLVRRRNLFGPMVQPPLIFAITAIGAVTFFGTESSGAGLKSLIISVALPLTSNFPTMGGTTAAAVAIGLFRWWRERDPDPEVRPNKPVKERVARDVDRGFDDEPGQGVGRRGAPERSGRDRGVAPSRRGRPELDEASVDERSGRRVPGRDPRQARDAGGRDGGFDHGRDPRRRDPGPGRGGEPPVRRRDAGADGGRPRDDRRGERRDVGRSGDAGQDGRSGAPGRQPRRRPPEDGYR
jgi:hypothetical protein